MRKNYSIVLYCNKNECKFREKNSGSVVLELVAGQDIHQNNWQKSLFVSAEKS